MALTYDQLSGITRDKFLPKLYDAIFNSNAALARAKSKGAYQKEDGGLSVLIPIEYAVATATGWYSGAQTLSTTDNDTFTAAKYSWKQLYANISISGADKLKNGGSDTQVINLVKAKVKNAEKTMLDSLCTGIYSSGSDSNSIAGFRQQFSTSNTVGGIATASYSWWNAQIDSTTTTLTIAAMQTLLNSAQLNDNGPSVCFATKANYNRYYALLQPQQRFVDTDTAKGGFQSLMFNGIPIISDTHATANYMFFIDEENWKIIVHKDRDMAFVDFIQPINQDVEVAKVYWFGAMGFSSLRTQAMFSALTA